MQLKHLFVSFLAFGSAIAAANPAVNDHDGVEARGDSTKSCPQAMYYDKSKGKCSCSPGYYWETNSCRPRCGSDNSAYYSSSSDNCICRNKAMRFNSSKRGCDCGQGKTWDSYGNKCVNSCGGGASLVKGQCTCPSSAQKYDTSKKTCSNRCQPGTTWNGSKCVSSCKAGTSWNGSKCVSVCKAGTSWNGSKCTSICKAGETYNGSKCVSSCKSGETYNGSKCVSVCKAGTSWNGSKCTSICKSGETYNGSKCVSSCKSGETWNGSKCVSSCKTGETWNGSKCVSVCKDGATYRGNACQCPKPGYEYKNSKCVLSQPCGTEATLKSGVCVCNQDTMDYNTATKKCACPRDYEWNKSAGKCTETCKDGATREGNVCKCPKDGYEYEYSKCVLHCGYEAHAESGACVCNQDTKVFDTTSKKCACPKDTEWNKRAGKCSEVCGGESNYNTRTNACECSGGRVYKNKACACPEKTIFKNGKCVPDCGTSAWYNTYKEECVCKTEGQEYDTEKGCGCFKAGEVYNKDKKACVPDCGTSAWYNTYKEECVCKTEGQEYDAEKGCGCFKEDETYDEDEKACLPNCGDAAGWSSFHKECRCRNSNLDYDSEHKTCGCKEGYELKDKACSPICPSDAKYVKADGNTPATCACIKDGYDWDSVKTSCVSKCPKDADWESTKCVCHNSNYESIDGGECKCPAGSISRSRGRCEPACEHGAEWSHRKNGCVCKEPNTKYTTEACVCADGYVANADSGECEPKCPSSAYFKDGKCHCKNSAFEFYEAEDNGKGVCRCADDSIAWGPEKKYCKPNCGKYADWRGEKCVCKLKDSTYVEKDVECECKTGYSLNKVGECRPTCPDSADYSPATDGKEATCECRGDGLSYDKDTNSCSPICPDTATYVKATETDPATCKCKAQSKKFEDGECVNKCPSDASYVPKDGTKEETCRCLSDYKLWNGESCKPKCADGQKPVKDEDAETFTCQCRDESKKAVGDLCKPKCPQDSTYAPKTDKAPETCKCDNKHLEYRNDECQCPEETEPHGKFCVPVCIEKASFKRGRGCVCDDEKAELVGDKEKKCQCIKGYVPDTNTGKCVAFCPSNADFVEGTDGELDSCTCKNSELEYKEKECKCPKGSSLEGDFCKPDTCPKGAHVDKTTKPWSCACDVDGAEVKGENEAAECKCPALKPRTLNGKCVACPTGSSVSEDGKSCVCEAGRYINHLDKCLCDNLKEPQGNKCQPNCGLLAKVSGDVCECYVKNAMFVDKDKSCPCPTGSKKYLADILKGKFECRCDQALLKDSVFNADKTKCECAQGFKPVDKKCVPDCTAPLVASGNKCVCPTESHKVVPVSGGPDKCIPLCQVIDPNPVYKRTPITIPEECFCDPAKYDWLSDVEKCSERCPTGFKHKAGDSTGLCVCDESTHGENTDGQCVPICVDYSPAPPDRRRNTVTPPAACFCDPKTHKSYEDGSVCVPNCPAPGETHNKDDNYECFCDPSTSGEVEVNGELTCVENCYVGVPAPPPGKKRTDDPAPPATCFCDGGVDGAYDDSIPGLCLEKCPRGEEHKPDGDHECWCNTETSTTDLTGTCLPNCGDDKPINAGKENECYCNEDTHHADGETCKLRCGPLQDAEECFCDEESDEWEVVEGKCVKPCEGALTHDTLENNLECICDTVDNHYDEDAETCTPLCHANDPINKDLPNECYCNDEAPSTFVKENNYCVEACTIKNQKFSSATPPVCECPAGYYSDGADVCQPRCTDGGKFKNTDDACYCDDSDPTKWLKVGDFCYKPCPKKNEEHSATFPHACGCPSDKFVDGNFCNAPCNDGDKFDGPNGCHCPTGPTSDWEKVMSDGSCRKKCADTETRDPMTRTCKCKTDATRPLAGATCECPANSKPKAAACECDDPANKEMFNMVCVDKCMDGSSREKRVGNYDYGKCICSGQKSFYDTTAKKCKCPGGKQFRQGQCRDTPCPTIPYNSYYNTRYDPVAEKCVCLKNNNTPDNSKTFYENYGLCF